MVAWSGLVIGNTTLRAKWPRRILKTTNALRLSHDKRGCMIFSGLIQMDLSHQDCLGD